MRNLCTKQPKKASANKPDMSETTEKLVNTYSRRFTTESETRLGKNTKESDHNQYSFSG